MSKFDKFAVLDPFKQQRDFASVIKGFTPSQWTALDDQLFRTQADVAIGGKSSIFDHWSALDPARQNKELFTWWDD